MAREESAYRKVVRKTWRKKRFRLLKPEIQRFLLYLWTSPESDTPGIYYISIPTIADDLGISPATVKQRLRYCIDNGWLMYDFECRIIFFPKWFEYDPPSNANTVISYKRKALDLPETNLIHLYLKTLIRYAIRYDVPLDEAYIQPIGTPSPSPSPSPSPEQEQEQKNTPEADSAVADSKKLEQGLRQSQLTEIVEELQIIPWVKELKSSDQYRIAGRIYADFKEGNLDGTVAIQAVKDKRLKLMQVTKEGGIYFILRGMLKDAVQVSDSESRAHRNEPTRLGDILAAAKKGD